MTEELFDKEQPTVKVLDDGKIVVGDNQYNTPEDVYQGKLKADEHIAIIQAENKELKDQLQENKTQDTTLNSILERLDKEDKSQLEDYEDTSGGEYKQGNDSVDPAAIKRMVKEESLNLYQEEQQRLKKEETIEVIKKNQDKIKNALIERTGSPQEAKEAWDRYKNSTSYNEQIYQLQVIQTPDALVDAIAPVQSPNQKVVNFNGVNIPRSNHQSSSKNAGGPKPRSYYAKMMKEDSRKYWTPENQIQMKQDMASMGMEAHLNR